jgi:hypothetical protein
MFAGVARITVLGSLLVLACGGAHAPLSSNDGSAGSGGASGTGAGTGTGGAMGTTPCPPSAPPTASSCFQEHVTCSWGDDIRGDTCRTEGTCSSRQWQIVEPDSAACRPLQDVGTCPANSQGTACAQDSTCTTADGNVCLCTNCPPNLMTCEGALFMATASMSGAGGAGSTWYCPAPVMVEGCPPWQPNLGEACDKEGVTCTYDQFVCGQPEKVCSGGIWVDGAMMQCPQ